MEGFDLTRKGLDGDFTVLQEWMDIHSKKIERFAFQYGLTLEMAYDVTLDTFVSFRNELENMDDVESILQNLYKLAIEKVARTEPLLPVTEGVFSFVEDAELHSEMFNSMKDAFTIHSYNLS